VRSTRTTICCSAVALIVVGSTACGTRARLHDARGATHSSGRASKRDATALSTFPLQAVWTLSLNAQLAVGAAPAFEGSRGFFPLDDHRIVAYDLAAGEQMWLANASPTMTPAAGGDLLFFAQPGGVGALRIADGSVAWSFELPDALAVPPVFDNQWLIIATVHGEVVALRATDGSVIWRRNVASPAHARPALAADRVYVPTEDGRVVALRVDTGATLWDHRLGGAVSDIVALDDRLFLGSNDNFFYCLKTQDGERDWPWRTGADIVGLPVVDDHAVYFVSLDNILWALNRSNGNQRWKRPLPLRPTSGPLRVGQALVVPGFAAKLPAYKVEDGSPAGDIPLVGELAAPPHLVPSPEGAGAMVIVTTRDIIKGATVTALTRSFEPPIVPLEPLPNPTTLTPAARLPTDR
jgi:outer membrane protein assembly factor BamB